MHTEDSCATKGYSITFVCSWRMKVPPSALVSYLAHDDVEGHRPHAEDFLGLLLFVLSQVRVGKAVERELGQRA